MRIRVNRDYKNYEKNDRDHEKRKLWNIENHETYSNYSIKSRNKKKSELGEEEYNRINTESHYNWYYNQSDEKRDSMNKINQNNPNIRLGSLKLSAKDRNILWKLTDEYALKLINKLCFYCDGKSENSCNGIDRIDNDIGYIETNCVSCCYSCNFIKCDRSIMLFLDKIEHILVNKNIINGNLYPDAHIYVESQTYNNYILISKRREINFELTEEEYFSIKSKECYLCGIKGKKYNGIDRVDNNICYIKDNCKPCCYLCNTMKYEFTLDFFLKHIEKIHKKRINIIKDIKIIDNNYHNLSENDLNIIRNNIKINNKETIIPLYKNRFYSNST